MASETGESARNAVASVASRLFGTAISPDAVIEENLRRATDPEIKVKNLGQGLAQVLDRPIPDELSDEALRSHPLAVWIEMEIGLEDVQRLRRRPPITLDGAAARLAEHARRDQVLCRERLQSMLMLMSRPEHERGGVVTARSWPSSCTGSYQAPDTSTPRSERAGSGA